MSAAVTIGNVGRMEVKLMQLFRRITHAGW